MTCLSDVFVPLTIAEDAVQEGALQLLAVIRPNWPRDSITFKMFTDGITNKLVCCMHRDASGAEESVLVRIYGNKTDLLIDRSAELRNHKVLLRLGLAPDLYGVFQNGLAYEFLSGVTLKPETVIDPKIWNLVARMLARMHKIDLPPQFKKHPMLWDKIEQFLSLVPEPFTNQAKQERFAKDFGTTTKLRIEYERLKKHLSMMESPIVFAHNDLLLGNIIYNETVGKVTFIDYEYADYNFQAYDIANHFAEFVGISGIDYSKYPKKDFQLRWLNVYLQEYLGVETPPVEHVERLYREVNQFVLATHFLWGVWALIQFEHSHIDFDFEEFASIRFAEYYRLRDSVFQCACPR